MHIGTKKILKLFLFKSIFNECFGNFPKALKLLKNQSDFSEAIRYYIL